MYITKGIVERHQGSICAWSGRLGCGTTFEVELPTFLLDEPAKFFPSDETENTTQPLHQSLHQGSSDSETSKSVGLKVLIVEDVSSNRKLLRRILERAGHICTEAENGQAAVDTIRDSPFGRFDTILMGKLNYEEHDYRFAELR